MRTTHSVLRTAGTAICLAATIGVATGCSGQPTQTETRSYEVTDQFTTLSVISKGGRIDIVTAATNTTRVTEELRWDNQKPTTRRVVQGDELVVDTTGCSDVNHHCDIAYVIEIPAGRAVRLDSDGGEVSLRALTGDLDVVSGGGKVRAEAMGSRDIVTRTGGGAVDIEFSVGPNRVDLDTEGGSAVVRLPEETYAVDVDTDGGTDQIAVRVDPASPRTIGIRTHGGDASVQNAST
jgi:hypothetical protein